jgi:hypothetical protein
MVSIFSSSTVFPLVSPVRLVKSLTGRLTLPLFIRRVPSFPWFFLLASCTTLMYLPRVSRSASLLCSPTIYGYPFDEIRRTEYHCRWAPRQRTVDPSTNIFCMMAVYPSFRASEIRAQSPIPLHRYGSNLLLS